MIDLVALQTVNDQRGGRQLFGHGLGDNRDNFIAHTGDSRQLYHAAARIIIVGDIVDFVNVGQNGVDFGQNFHADSCRGDALGRAI